MRLRNRSTVATSVIASLALSTVAGVSFATPARALPRQAPDPVAAVLSGTQEQALAQARTTAKPVPVTAATTATDSLVANPDGTLTRTRSLLPVRKIVNHAWTALDATLTANPDGTISPKVTTGTLSLSGGGSGPMATMRSADDTLSLSLPFTLPTPTLSGATATYPSVLPGVDLQITADKYGGFADVLVVHDATAAANPAVRNLGMTLHSTGLRIAADAAGNLTASDSAGHAVFTAPTPRMWDSARPAGQVDTITNPTTGQVLDTATSMPVASTPSGPGEAAHRADIAVAATASALTLTPATALLSGANTTWPLYLDPGWTNNKSGWASVAEYFPSSSYWNNTPDPEGFMQVGNSGSMWSHTLVNFLISALSGATIQSAQLNLTEVLSFSCSPSTVNVYAPSTVLNSSNATWNYWAGVNLGNVAASATVAHGYSSSCPRAGVGFDVTSAVQSAVTAGRSTQTFVLTGVNESGDHNSWKEFDPASASLSVTYDRRPNVPSGLTTSPATACSGNPQPSIVGDGSVTLYTPVSDPDGGNLTVTVDLLTGSINGTVVDHSVLSYPSGSTAVRVVAEAALKAASGSPAGITQFYWHATVSDGTLSSSSWSAACTFKFDPSRPGAPGVTIPASATIGQPLTVNVTRPAGGDTPASYIYQLNAAAPVTVAADANGNATITVTPTRFTNTLTVNSTSAGGNLSLDAGRAVFTATPPAIAQADGDLNGDNIPDLLTTGTGTGLPDGLWLAPAQASAGNTTGTGQVAAAPLNIGANGNGVSGSHSAADFANAIAITGRFTSNSIGGLQDILDYNPVTGTGAFLAGNGDGSVLTPRTDNVWEVTTSTFSDSFFTDGSSGPGDKPQQLANAGNTTGTGGYPDLIGTNGDAAAGYYLAYYDNIGGVGQYIPDRTTVVPPDGGSWKNWTIATCQLNNQTNMFLWNKTTGELDLWANLAHTFGGYDLTHDPQRQLAASGWNTNAAVTLHAADINGDATPDLYTVASNGHATTYLFTLPSTLTPQNPQTLLTSAHTWPLADNTAGNATSASDVTGALTATGTGGATWNTADLFSPDVAFDGATGALATSGPAIHTNADFTISAWARPNASGGVVLSQNGPHNAGFILAADATTKQWTFGMTTSDSNTAYQYVSNPNAPVILGAWAHLTATYHASTGIMALYVNGNPVTGVKHTAAWDAAGSFHIGNYHVADGYAGFFNGKVANVQTWNQTLTPEQISDVSGSPGHIMLLSNNGRYTIKTTWAGKCSTMSWIPQSTGGTLSVNTHCATVAQTVFGSSNVPNVNKPFMVFQGDGNLVIYPAYPTSANAIWATDTYNHPNDVLFLQDDGNAVIYDADGAVLWSSGTANYLNGSALFSHANGEYVSAATAGADPLIANRATAGLWETFDVLDLGNGNIALRSHANGLLVTADNAGAKPLIASRTAIGPWETFQLVHNADKTISLKSMANSMYVSADNAGASALIANRTTIGDWEKFDLFTG